KSNTELNEVFMKSGVDNISINTAEDYVKSLRNLFKSRELR
ncbi:MAG: DUF58 domain-containing protein, partial [Bacteroidota bacterium]|nr:DUF58 domain-containing protein [Bacteroidota bacterium]